MTGGISIEPLYSGLHACDGSDPRRTREDCNRIRDDGEETMSYYVVTEDEISRRLTNKDQVIIELLTLLDRIDADLQTRVVDSPGDWPYVLYG